jgi:hypothetical protein
LQGGHGIFHEAGYGGVFEIEVILAVLSKNLPGEGGLAALPWAEEGNDRVILERSIYRIKMGLSLKHIRYFAVTMQYFKY